MRSTALLMLASAVFGSSLAIAQSNLAQRQDDGERAGAPHALGKFGERLQAADTDGDGALSRAEAEAAGLTRLLKHFDKLDADGDGKVTPEELRSLLQARLST